MPFKVLGLKVPFKLRAELSSHAGYCRLRNTFELGGSDRPIVHRLNCHGGYMTPATQAFTVISEYVSLLLLYTYNVYNPYVTLARVFIVPVLPKERMVLGSSFFS